MDVVKNINPVIFNKGNIFFLKKSGGSGGKSVYAVNSFETMEKNFRPQNFQKNYINQLEKTELEEWIQLKIDLSE